MDFEFSLFDLRIIQRTDLGLWVRFKFKPSNKNPGVKTNKNSALVLIVCVVLNLQMFNMGHLSRFIIYILNLFKLCPPNFFLRHSMEVRSFPKKNCVWFELLDFVLSMNTRMLLSAFGSR